MLDSKAMRIVYMGTPEFAVPPLKALVEGGYNVVAVVTAPDKPAGRGLQMQQSAVKQYAERVGLPVLQPVKLRDEAFVSQFEALRADLGIVIAFRMLPEIIWSNPSCGTFNLHASLLPQYRGAAPINWAIINGETQTGLTTFLLDPQIDRGAILGRRTVDILPEDTFGTLHDRLMNLGPELVLETVEKIAAGTAHPVSQETIDAGVLKPAPKIFKDDCLIDWCREGEQIRNFIRGLSPYPAAWSMLSLIDGGKEPLPVKIFAADFTPLMPGGTPAAPGTILSDGKTYIRVACTDGFLDIAELQIAGKKRMTAAELLRGFQIADHFFHNPENNG